MQSPPLTLYVSAHFQLIPSTSQSFWDSALPTTRQGFIHGDIGIRSYTAGAGQDAEAVRAKPTAAVTSRPGSLWPHCLRPAGRVRPLSLGPRPPRLSPHRQSLQQPEEVQEQRHSPAAPEKGLWRPHQQPPSDLLPGPCPITVTPTTNTSPTSTVFLETRREGYFTNRKKETESGGSSGAELQIRSPESRTWRRRTAQAWVLET